MVYLPDSALRETIPSRQDGAAPLGAEDLISVRIPSPKVSEAEDPKPGAAEAVNG